jgi:hypothetical protein
MDTEANEKWAWLAGLFDGEGCIGFGRQSNNKELVTIRMMVGVTHQPTMVVVERMLEEAPIQFSSTTQRCKSGSMMYKVSVASWRGVFDLVTRLAPYSVTKKERMLLAQKAVSLMLPYEHAGPTMFRPERLVIHGDMARMLAMA